MLKKTTNFYYKNPKIKIHPNYQKTGLKHRLINKPLKMIFSKHTKMNFHSSKVKRVNDTRRWGVLVLWKERQELRENMYLTTRDNYLLLFSKFLRSFTNFLP